MAVATFEKQRAVIYDLISAGEIEGLVGGISGVYLNDTAIMDRGNMESLQAKLGEVSVSGTSVTNATSAPGIGLFTDVSLSDGARYLQIAGAGRTSTLASALKENDTEIVSSDNGIFTQALVQPIDDDSAIGPVYGGFSAVSCFVRIPASSKSLTVL